MFKPVDMRKVAIVMDKRIKADVVARLQELGVLHLTTSRFSALKKDEPLSHFQLVSKLLVDVRTLLKKLEIAGFNVKQRELSPAFFKRYEHHLQDVVKRFNAINEQLTTLLSERETLLKELERWQERKSLAQSLLGFDVDFSVLMRSQFSFSIVDKDEVKAERVVWSEDGSKALVFLGIGQDKPDLPLDFGKPSEELKKCEAEIERIRKRLGEVDVEISKILTKEQTFLSQLLPFLNVLSERFSSSLNFAKSDELVVAEGWVPVPRLKTLKDVLNKEFRNGVEVLELDEKEGKPVLLNNPPLLKPFEFLATFLSLPSHNDFDPTFFVFLFFPFMYGMVVGDVGYALLSMLLSLVLLRVVARYRVLVMVVKLWLYSSVFAALWGVVFDEWFGMPHTELLRLLHEFGLPVQPHTLYHGISRMHDLSTVMVMSLVVGLVQIFVGFVLGFLVEWRESKKAAMAKLAWVLFLAVGTALVVDSFVHSLPNTLHTPLYVLMLLTVVVIVWGEGLMGLFEVPGVVSNVLSYVRIAGVGVVGVVLAEIINEFLAPSPSLGVLNLIIFPLFIVFHFANAFLAMFESLVQVGRLNLVEFYSKFYHGGGKPFKPFSLPFKKR